MTHNEMISVIQAHKEGKQIQAKVSDNAQWVDIYGNKPVWDFSQFNYRVKPEDKYIPFTFEDNLVGKVIQHKINKIKLLITKQSLTGINTENGFITYGVLLDYYTFLDNTPCGNKQ